MELECSVKISNKYGLHARASTRLAEVAKRFHSSIRLSRVGANEDVDAKSILGILTLGAEKGQTLRIRASGEDAKQAVDALLEVVRQNFGEE